MLQQTNQPVHPVDEAMDRAKEAFRAWKRGQEMATIKVTPELEAELSALAAASGCELVHCEFKGGLLRLFIDRPEGVTLDDCELVARQASAGGGTEPVAW